MLRACFALYHYVAIGMNSVGARASVSSTQSPGGLYLRRTGLVNTTLAVEFSAI